MVGPAGTLVVIDTKSDLKAFVGETLVGDVHINLFNVHCMLGILKEASPRHVSMWQPLSRLQFIQHEKSDEPLPVVGGLGKGGLEHFISLHKQEDFIDSKGEVARSLRNLLLGTYKTGSGSSKKFSNCWKGWSLVPPPENLEQWLPRQSFQAAAAQQVIVGALERARRALHACH